MLQEKIQINLIKAMKSANIDEKEILSFLLSRVKNKAIDNRTPDTRIADIEVIAIIQKLIKELGEEIDMYRNAGRLATVSLKEKQISILQDYLPKMLSEEEIKAEINKLEDKSMPSIMRYFKLNFTGSVDMGLVSKIAREVK